MTYKAINGTNRKIKLQFREVTEFIPAPSLVGLVYSEETEWIKEAGPKFGIKDVGSYVRRGLERGECILVKRNDDTVIAKFNRLTVTIQLPCYSIVDVQ